MKSRTITKPLGSYVSVLAIVANYYPDVDFHYVNGIAIVVLALDVSSLGYPVLFSN